MNCPTRYALINSIPLLTHYRTNLTQIFIIHLCTFPLQLPYNNYNTFLISALPSECAACSNKWPPLTGHYEKISIIYVYYWNFYTFQLVSNASAIKYHRHKHMLVNSRRECARMRMRICLCHTICPYVCTYIVKGHILEQSMKGYFHSLTHSFTRFNVWMDECLLLAGLTHNYKWKI